MSERPVQSALSVMMSLPAPLPIRSELLLPTSSVSMLRFCASDPPICSTPSAPTVKVVPVLLAAVLPLPKVMVSACM